MAYYTPQVRVYQEFAPQPSDYTEALAPCIIGKLGIPHRYSDADEKALIALGEHAGAQTYAYPGVGANSVIDEAYTRLFIDRAKLEYLSLTTDLTQATLGSDQVFAYTDPTTPNALLFNGFSPATNGNYSRSALLGERDVQRGDSVRLTVHAAGTSDEVCETQTFETTVTDYIVEVSDSIVGTPLRVTNRGATARAEWWTDADGPTAITPTALATSPLAEDVYLLAYQGTSDSGFTYSTVTSSGRDHMAETALAGDATTIALGAYWSVPASLLSDSADDVSIVHIRVSTYTPSASAPARTGSIYDTATDPLTLSGSYTGIPSGDLTTRVVVRVAAKYSTGGCSGLDLNITTADSTTTVSTVVGTGADSAFYVFPVIPGITGKISIADASDIASFPDLNPGDSWEYDFSSTYNPPTLAATGTYTGSQDDTYIVTCVQGGALAGTTFPKVAVRSALGNPIFAEKVITSANNTLVLPTGVTLTFTGANSEMALGDTWSLPVFTGRNQAVTGLVLRDRVPHEFETHSLEAINPIHVSFFVVRDVEVPVVQDTENREVEVPATTTQAEFPGATLTILGGAQYLQYREWAYSPDLGTVASVADLDAVPGALHPDNPLKYGIYKALANSNGTQVQYIAVQDDSVSSWGDAIAQLSGSASTYIIVPLTESREVQNLVAALVAADSSPEVCAWKEAIFSTVAPTSTTVVSGPVLATVTQPSNSTRYVQVDVTSGNGNFLDTVQPGDTLLIDGQAYEVDHVQFDSRLTLVTGPPRDTYALTPQGITVLHTLTRAETAAYYVDWAQSFASSRITCVYPGVVGEAGSYLPGYFLACAVAGQRCGVNPWQGLTRVSIAGFDDFSGDRLNATQLKTLAAGGVWVVTESSDGTPYTYHALTSDTTDLNTSEEAVTRNMDAISFTLRNVLDTFIGRYQLTPAILRRIETALDGTLRKMVVSGQVLTWEITELSQDVLLRDTINLTVAVTLPYALNVIELHIIAV